MKRVLYLALSFAFLQCTDPPTQEASQPASPLAESISPSQRIAQIDDLVDSIGFWVMEPTTKKGKAPMPVYSDKDNIKVVKLPNGISQVSFMGIHGELELGPVFYLENGKVFFYRNRSWLKIGNAYAHETQIYFDGDERFIFARERHIDLPEGHHPSPLMKLPLEPSKRSQSELMQEYNGLWLAIRAEAMKVIESIE